MSRVKGKFNKCLQIFKRCIGIGFCLTGCFLVDVKASPEGFVDAGISIELVDDFLPIDDSKGVILPPSELIVNFVGLEGSVQWQCMVVRSENTEPEVSYEFSVNTNKYELDSEVYLVDYWRQMSRPRDGTAESKPEHRMTPELLLPISEGSQFRISPYIDSLLDATVEQGTAVNITSAEPAHLCVKIKMPAYDLTSPELSTQLNVTSDEIVVGRLKINIEVVGKAPPKSRLFRAIYYHGSFDADDPGFVSGSEAKRQLEDIRDHGFTGITVIGSDQLAMVRLAKLAISLDVGQQIILAFKGKIEFSIKETVQLIEKLGSMVFVMTVNEPNNSQKLNNHLKRVTDFKEMEVQSYVPIAEKYLSQLPTLTVADWTNISYRSKVPDLPEYRTNTKRINTIYWQSYMEMPVLNRYLSGFALCNSEYDGIFPYAYQHKFLNDKPYMTDTRHMGSLKKSKEFPHTFRKYYYSVYPGTPDNITTLQWEALQVGLDELGVCLALKDAIHNILLAGDALLADSITREMDARLSELNSGSYRANYLNAYEEYRGELSDLLDSTVSWMLSALHATQERLNRG